MRGFFAFCALVIATTAYAQSQWDHDGSVMVLHASGVERKFSFVTPRSGLSASVGTILFSGEKSGDNYSGTAYKLSLRCGNLGFAVSGPVASDQRSVTLYGKAPIRDRSCRVTSYRDEVLSFKFIDPISTNGFALTLNSATNGFHIPHQWRGRTIIVTPPENEHVVFAIEDMFAAAKLKLDVLVGQTKGINNAFAVIDEVGGRARRLVVIDPEWSYRFPHYRVIIAHELGHHVCRHTLDRFNASNGWEMELEADRAGGALLRASYADGQGSVGGEVINLSDIIATIRLLGPGSETHPPAELRIRAFTEGWNSGSPCLHTAYVPINPFPKLDPTVVERIALRYGELSEWCFFGSELVTLGSCQARHPRVRVQVSGNHLKISLMKPNLINVSRVFPPDYRGLEIGSVLFEGTSDKEKITGKFWHRVQGCAAISYDGGGNFRENNGLFLGGEIPKLSGCRVEGAYASTLHFFKALEDIIPLGNR